MLPLNVIEQLAKKLRGRESAHALKTLSSLTKAASVAHTGQGVITEDDIGFIRGGLVDRTLPLPWGEVTFAHNDKYITLDAFTVMATPTEPAPRGTYLSRTEWVILATGEDGVDYVVAAEDAFLIPAGKLYAPLSDFPHLSDKHGVVYGNLRIAPYFATYTLTSWSDVAVVLNGIYNPSINSFRTELVVEPTEQQSDPDAPVDEARTTVDGFNAELVRAVFADIGATITLDDAVGSDIPTIVQKIRQSYLEKDKADKDAEYDIVKLEALYGKDFANIFSSITGSVTAIKIRRAFKEHFTKKWDK